MSKLEVIKRPSINRLDFQFKIIDTTKEALSSKNYEFQVKINDSIATVVAEVEFNCTLECYTTATATSPADIELSYDFNDITIIDAFTNSNTTNYNITDKDLLTDIMWLLINDTKTNNKL